MKNTLKINLADKTIVMDRTFAKLAADTRSEEYAHLQQIRRDYPTYTVVQRQIRRNNTKVTYAGLTYDYMKNYIMTHGTKEEIERNLATFKEKTLISKCHNTPYRYPVIKSWFLKQFPEIEQYSQGYKAEKEKERNEADNISAMESAA